MIRRFAISGAMLALAASGFALQSNTARAESTPYVGGYTITANVVGNIHKYQVYINPYCGNNHYFHGNGIYENAPPGFGKDERIHGYRANENLNYTARYLSGSYAGYTYSVNATLEGNHFTGKAKDSQGASYPVTGTLDWKTYENQSQYVASLSQERRESFQAACQSGEDTGANGTGA